MAKAKDEKIVLFLALTVHFKDSVFDKISL